MGKLAAETGLVNSFDKLAEPLYADWCRTLIAV